MNETQAAQAMATMAAAFSKTIEEHTMAVWFNSCLASCPVEVARVVVERIIAEEQFFPSPARFSEMRRTIERGLEPTYAALPAPVATPTQQEKIKAHIANARQHLADAKTPRRTA